MSVCKGKLKNGKPCSCKAKMEGYCKRHYKKSEDCPICLDSTNEHVGLACEHRFHHDCIREWIQRGRRTCPVCRADISEATIKKLGIDIDIRLEVIRVVEMFFLGDTNDAVSDVSSRYAATVPLIMQFLKSEELLRRDIIDFMGKRLKGRAIERQIAIVQREITNIELWTNYLMVAVRLPITVTNETALLFKKIMIQINKLQNWERIV